VLTRGAVAAERTPGGFAATYRVLTAFEDAGRVRRGYFVEGLGAAQFATGGAVDRLRAGSAGLGGARNAEADAPRTLVLAAADPANPYGAALPWPDRPVAGEVADPDADTSRAAGSSSGHRAARKAGALVVLTGGQLVLYVERGGKSLLSFTDDADALAAAADALALAVRDGALGRLTVERADGAGLLGSGHPLAAALESAGFRATPRGLRLRA
jgi:ATP-dependent Lhr-like helicase